MPAARGRRAALQAIGAVLAVTCVRLAAVEPAKLPQIEDLAKLREESRRERLPVLLFFTIPGCPYCHDVRQNYLAPRVRQGRQAGVIVREIDITSSRAFRDFDGHTLTETELARRFDVRVAPVVVLVNGALERLTEPLVGIDRSGFYESYLSSAIEAAQSKLRQ